MRRTALLPLVPLLLLATGCAGDGDEGPDYDPVAPPRVALDTKGVPDGLTLGVLVSATAPLGEGAEYLGPAAGARVATYRLAQGGATVTLTVVDDHGDAATATKAVADFAAAGVSGVVAATTGDHLGPALKKAADAKLAVLLPYETEQVAGATTSWLTGPSAPQVQSTLRGLLVSQKLARPWVLHGEGYDDTVLGLAAAGSDTALRPGQSAAEAVAPALSALSRKTADSVVVAASADTSAALVAQLQGRTDVPVVLAPAATAPRFGQSLAEVQGSDGTATTAGALYSVGTEGSASTAFVAAVQSAAKDSALTGLLDEGSTFGEAGAATADAASHDAVLALVRAAQKAGSTDAAKVLDALSVLTLGGPEGLVGPALDFSDKAALAAGSLVALASTTQDTGDRVGVAEALPPLTWFALPRPASG